MAESTPATSSTRPPHGFPQRHTKEDAQVIVIVDHDAAVAESLRANLDVTAKVLTNIDGLRRHLDTHQDSNVVVIGPSIEQEAAFRVADTMRIARPALGVILVRKRVDTALLADALRSGVREVVGERDITSLAGAVHRAAELSERLREKVTDGGASDSAPLGRLVTVFSAKGGCGKTTLATNLAAALADGGKREVVLVDLDLAFGDVAIALQLFPAHTIADAVPMIDTLDETALKSLLTPHSPGLAALVAPVEPSPAETITAGLVSTILHFLKQSHSYVVVDTPPAFTDHVLAAFDESDVVALLATLDIPALKNLKVTLETMELLNYPKERWRVVLNRADSKVGLSLSEVEKTLRMPISAQIPSSRSIPASINRGEPLMHAEPNHPASMAIKQFAEQHVLISAPRQIPTELRSDRRAGLLRRKARTS